MLSIVIYFICFGISISLSYFYQKLKKAGDHSTKSILGKFFWFLIIFFPTLFLAATRKGIGTDYDAYSIFFEMSKEYPMLEFLSISGTEPAFAALTKLSSSISPDVEILWLLSSIITFLFLFLALDNASEVISIPFALLAFYALLYAPSFNIIRQIIAGSIVCFSYKAVIKKEPIRFCLLIILAALFHKSAIVFGICYLYNLVDLNNRFLKKTIVYLSMIIFMLLIPYIPVVGSKIWFIKPYFIRYIPHGGSMFIFYYIFRAPIYLFIIVLFSPKLEKQFSFDLYYFIALYEIPILLLTLLFEWAFRLSYYTQFAQIIIVAGILSNIKTSNERVILKALVVLFYILYFILFYFIMENDHIFPYESICF